MYHNEIHKFETGKDRNFKIGGVVGVHEPNLLIFGSSLKWERVKPEI